MYASDDSGATLYAGGLNIGGTAVTSTAAELNILDGVTATATELNLIDGVTATTAEINYVDGVTSSIQDQLDAKQATLTAGSGISISGSTISAGITEGSISDGAVTTVKLADDAVTAAKIVDGTITAAKLASGVGGASSMDDLSDILVEGNSLYIGLSLIHI